MGHRNEPGRPCEAIHFGYVVGSLMLVPTDVAAWVARITAVTQQLRLG